MAKKKKTAKVLEVKEQQPIIYSGKVTINGIKNGKITSSKTYHNEGTKELFNFLLDCLAGKWLPDLQPRFVCTARDDNHQLKYVSNNIIAAEEIAAHTEGEDPYVEYKFLLPNKPQYNKVGGTGFDKILLYNANKKPAVVANNAEIDTNYSMIISLDKPHKTEIDEEILVIWQLKIENPKPQK